MCKILIEQFYRSIHTRFNESCETGGGGGGEEEENSGSIKKNGMR